MLFNSTHDFLNQPEESNAILFPFKLLEFGRRFDFGNHTRRALVKEEVIQFHVAFFGVLGLLCGLRVSALTFPEVRLERIW